MVFYSFEMYMDEKFNNHLLFSYDWNCINHLLVEMAFVYEFLNVIVPVFMDYFFNDFASASCLTFSNWKL